LKKRKEEAEKKKEKEKGKDGKKTEPEEIVLQTDDHSLLNFEISEGGSNLSSGEKALICICRAVLRKSKVVILDEATANIDIETEQKI
jgi:ABC-type multidrug transport system fused ATPase/permease subunit